VACCQTSTATEPIVSPRAIRDDLVMAFTSSHIRRHRRSLAITYSGVIVENTFESLYPFAIGLAVDDLLDDSYRGAGLFVAVSLVGLSTTSPNVRCRPSTPARPTRYGATSR
jgi:hypothetical protein